MTLLTTDAKPRLYVIGMGLRCGVLVQVATDTRRRHRDVLPLAIAWMTRCAVGERVATGERQPGPSVLIAYVRGAPRPGLVAVGAPRAHPARMAVLVAPAALPGELDGRGVAPIASRASMATVEGVADV